MWRRGRSARTLATERSGVQLQVAIGQRQAHGGRVLAARGHRREHLRGHLDGTPPACCALDAAASAARSTSPSGPSAGAASDHSSPVALHAAGSGAVAVDAAIALDAFITAAAGFGRVAMASVGLPELGLANCAAFCSVAPDLAGSW